MSATPQQRPRSRSRSPVHTHGTARNRSRSPIIAKTAFRHDHDLGSPKLLATAADAANSMPAMELGSPVRFAFFFGRSSQFLNQVLI